MDKIDYSQTTHIDEGTDAYGISTRISFEGDQMIVKKSWDGKGLAEQCKAERIATSGQRWGEMRKVASIGMVEYARLATVKDNKERLRLLRSYLSRNPDFITFDRYLK